MKYQKEFEEISRYVRNERPGWMDDSEFEEMRKVEDGLIATLTSSFDADIETGIANGHSVERQMELLRKVLTKITPLN